MLLRGVGVYLQAFYWHCVDKNLSDLGGKSGIRDSIQVTIK